MQSQVLLYLALWTGQAGATSHVMMYTVHCLLYSVQCTLCHLLLTLFALRILYLLLFTITNIVNHWHFLATALGPLKAVGLDKVSQKTFQDQIKYIF